MTTRTLAGMKRLFTTLACALLLGGTAAAQPVTGLQGWDLFLDPGHGGSSQNTGVYGYSEANKVLAIGLHLRDLLLAQTDIDTVYLSRTRDVDVSLLDRVDMANTVGAAHFHSIHSNAAAPAANHAFVLWPQYPDGSEAVPNGGRRMSEIMADVLARGMRIPSRGAYGECAFYGVSDCRPPGARNVLGQGKGGSRNYVQSFTNMPSELSEAGFHTNPVQNQRNMNADWKRLEAQAMFWSILDYHGLPRPAVRIVTGIVRDVETGLPLNGAVVQVADTSYTTDTYESLFRRYTNDPEGLRNGFYYLDRLPAGPLAVRVTADGYAPFTGTVTPLDSTFTFFDAGLISTVPPRVTHASPADAPDRFRIVDPIVIDFSRRMEAASVEAAFTITPDVRGAFTWSPDSTRLAFRPDTLLPLTDYTVTIAGSARGLYGHAFDGDGDGTGGDPYTLRFRTGYPDTDAPRLTAASPRVNARDVELLPVISLTYDEPVAVPSLAGRVRLERTADGAAVPGQVVPYLVGGETIVTFFPREALRPGTAYVLTVDPGVADAFGNADPVRKQVRFTTGDRRAVVTPLDDFERDLGRNWWAPQQSGSTAGIVTDSTGVAADTVTVNLLTGSTTALGLRYGWDPAAGTQLIREYLDHNSPPAAIGFDAAFKLQAYVFGDGSGNRLRFAVDDATSTEVSPWYTIDWKGWRLVSWDLAADPVGAWIGDGKLDGRLRFDSIQLTHTPGAARYGAVVVDDLRLVREEQVSTAAERPGADLPDGVALHGNYPNPFNPTTTLEFSLAAPGPVTVRVFNALGAEVATLARQTPFAAGTHTLGWDAAGLPSGVYFCRLEAGPAVRTLKMTLLK